MLKLRRIGLDIYRENVAILARCCLPYRAEEFEALNKVEIHHDGGHSFATLMISDDPQIVGPEELGLTQQAFDQLGLEEGSLVSISHATPPRSLESVRRKVAGETLSDDEIGWIISDIAARRYSEMEIAAFLVGAASFLSTEEVLALTKAMARVGNQLQWDWPVVVDKHCIGGIPGNRTSMIVVPIVAAHGLPIPKTSSRAITSPAGTADTMEVLANVDLSMAEMRKLVSEVKGCLMWGGHVNLSPADDILISVERPLGIDTPEQMVASILSKKLAAGATHLVIDIPVGPTAKVRTHNEAVRLRKLFEHIGNEVGLITDILITDGSQPIGRGIGPVLEAREVMAVLNNEPEAPQDLKEKSLLLAGHVLDFDPALKGGEGHQVARRILENGQALATMERIIAAQGPQTQTFDLGSLTHDVLAGENGTVTAIDSYRLSRIARLAGAPMDKGSGIHLFKKIGDRVRKDEPLYRIYSDLEADFKFAIEMMERDAAFTIEPA